MSEVKKIATRESYGNALVEIGKENPNLVVLDADLAAAFEEARKTKGQPTAIVAKTIKGKDVSFMENKAGWHGKAPNDEELAIALSDLEKVGEALCQK